ncbi:MAG TPA: FlgD immunoglobulin-like domain containing protein [Bacteroidales bacterium]|nr:FlgD immunoglobulin-like domain containing protein [Bacteroidales bacterium]
MKKSLLLPFLLVLSCGLFTGVIRAQVMPGQPEPVFAPITPEEMFVLSNVPLVTLPEEYKGPNAPLLPVSVDNSTQPYFRPITSQVGLECGQSAGVAFNFTYEVDRLRNLPANTTSNQYPTHFVWDFLNSGTNMGVSFFDSWDIVRACGTMNVAEYGGSLYYGGFKRWINGYDLYYSGMHNRINSVKAIRCDNEEGLLTLKYWLQDHLEGSSIGGVGNIYGNYFGSVSTTLPAGTPEAGKYVQTSWGPSPSHAWTIVGYNDSIRFDYNGDGQYTNTIDLNGDGIVNMHDWEIGGLKFANGYAGTGWCNSGFCYTMYKCLADNITSGGIWNHTIYILDAKTTCQPKLTMKVTLKHTSRNRLKVTVGTSSDLTAQAPSQVLEYPIFNYQGGGFYMQGGTSEADKTIEFGLDLTSLLSRFNSGQTVKYFLQVQENDPGSSDEGEIVNCALIDYTSGSPVTYNFPTNNVPLYNNSITRISLNHATNFSKPSITNTSLPTGTVYQPYICQLTASGGTSPYLWDVQLTYPESTNSATFPNITTQPLTLTNTNTGYAILNLGFTFPFFNKAITKLYIYADGYILFDDQPYTYPYIVNKNLLFKQTSIISPFMYDLNLYSSQGDGIWYEGNATYAIIRWKASLNGMGGASAINMAVKLYPNGTIEYYYGNMNYPAGTAWTGGLSGGDNRNYQYSMINGASSITANTIDKFTSCRYPVEMTLSEDGLFSGTPQYAYTGLPITFRVTDNNGISNTKVLNFTANGVVMNYSIVSGTDSVIEYGETAKVSLSIQNISQQSLNNVNMTVTETDPYITFTDSTESIGTLGPGQILFFPDVFTFQVSPNIPDLHTFTIVFNLTSSNQNLTKEAQLTGHAPGLTITRVGIVDGDNSRLDPGETANVLMTFNNNGSAGIQDLNVQISSINPLITVIAGSGFIASLEPDSAVQVPFTISASPETPFENLFSLKADISAPNDFAKTDTAWFLSGEIIEDYESGTFDKFDWSFGLVPWYIDDYLPWEGNYCAQSGWTFDGANAELKIPVIVLQDGEISFMRKTSCEDDPTGANYDHLAFAIDGYEMGRWDGVTPWTYQSYPVTKGYHLFSWIYQKDESLSGNMDCVWIDFVKLPPFASGLPAVTAAPSSLEKTLDQGQTATDQILVTNTGGGILEYTVMVNDTSVNKNEVTDNLSGSAITCNTNSYVPGQAFSWNFTVTNSGTDNENIEEIRMDFPQGTSVTGATNFSGGSLGELICDGTNGNGASITWHGETTNGLGVIKPGESATTNVTGTIDESQTYDVFIVYSIRGDSTGASPHQAAKEIRIASDGLANNWLSFQSNTGDLFAGKTDTVTVNFNAQGMEPGEYKADILVRDMYNHIAGIPVTLMVNKVIGLPDPQSSSSILLLGNYPNPFSDATTIQYRLKEPASIRLEVQDMQGRLVASLVDNRQAAGVYRITWDGTSSNGIKLPGGVYQCRLTAGACSDSKKLIIIR